MNNGRYQKDLSQYESLELWDKSSIGELALEWGKKYGDRPAVVTEGDMLTYKELDRLSSELAYGLLDMGLKAGDHVVLQIPNGNSYPVSFLAIMKAGLIPVLALPAQREMEIRGLMELSGAVAYFIPDRYQGFDYIEMADNLLHHCPALQYIIVSSDYDRKQQKGDGFYELAQIRGEDRPLPEVNPYETAFYLLSGGTTGIPKMIPRTHADYMYTVRMCERHCGSDQNSVYLVSLPAEHNFPMSNPGILGTLDTGGLLVFVRNPSPDEILDAIMEYHVTITSMVPALAAMCLELLEADPDYDVSDLKILQIGGAMLEDSMADQLIEKWPAKLMQVFGTSEGLLFMTRTDDPDEIVSRYQGKPMSPAVEVLIVDEEDREVPPGEYGEVICRGPYTIDHYFGAPEANRSSFREDGFYRTGDRAVRNEEGYFRFGGRLKERINRAGEKIEPAEIESYLCMDPSVLEAVVVGIPDEDLGERSCAFVKCREGVSRNLQDIYRQFQEMGVALYKFPDQLEQVEFWPLTKIGKIDRKQLVKMMISE